MEEIEGRDQAGRFVKGNKCGRGRKISALRRAMLAEMTTGDMRAIIRTLIDKAKEGDVQTALCLMDRLVGKPSGMVELDAAENAAENEETPGAGIARRPVIIFGDVKNNDE